MSGMNQRKPLTCSVCIKNKSLEEHSFNHLVFGQVVKFSPLLIDIVPALEPMITNDIVKKNTNPLQKFYNSRKL